LAQRIGVSRPTVWRWQERFAESGVDRLLRDKTPHARQTADHGGNEDTDGGAQQSQKVYCVSQQYAFVVLSRPKDKAPCVHQRLLVLRLTSAEMTRLRTVVIELGMWPDTAKLA
jgi:hypothetical protein